MILEEEKFSLEENGSFKKFGYKIEANPTTFKMLFKNLYSNIIKAIVREISTNAWDSHVAAGREDIPFTVHLPNHFEPWFAVIDTGAGMPEAFVEEEYTTFFNSNKRGSNDAAGCFGLGAKVPFAYTDSFTVNVRYNGVETSYNPIKDQHGIPTLVKLSSKPTKERNGCEVKFAVESKDFSSFVNEALQIYRWFKVKPTIIGTSNFVYPKEEYLRETPEYAFLKNQKYSDSYIIMGNVAYPISASSLNISYYSSNRYLLDFIEYGVRLFMKIGDIQLTPSREAINYDDKTIANIIKSLQSAYEDIKLHVYDGVKDAKTLWEAKCKLKDISSSIFKYTNGDKVKWNNIEIEPFVRTPNTTIIAKEFKSSYGSKYRESDVHSIDCENNALYPIYHNDLGIKGIRGLKKYMVESNIRRYIVLADLPNIDSSKWLEETGLNEIVKKVSSLDDKYFKVIRQKGLGKGPTERSLLYKFSLDKTYQSTGDDFWLPEEIDMNEGGIYIPISRYYWVKNPAPNEITEHPKDNLKKLYQDILQFEPKFTLYGIIPSNMPKLKKYKGWQTLEEYLDELIKNNLSLKKLAKHTWSYDSRHAGIIANTENIKFHDKSYFGNFIKILKETKENLSNAKIIAYRNILLYRKVIDTSAMTCLNTAQTKIFDRYPLLPYVNLSSYSDVPEKHLKDYIETIESRNPLFTKVSNNGNQRKVKKMQTAAP